MSRIVAVAEAVPRLALTGVPICSAKASVASSSASSSSATPTVVLVAPAAIVAVPPLAA